MSKTPAPDTAIERGLAFLSKEQQADGSFISHSSARMMPFRSVRTWRTVFVPALMLQALGGTQEPQAADIRHGLADFLLGQKDDNWSFNYWSRRAPEYRSQPYPNDLDDTFCALSGLYMHDPSIIDEEALAKAVKLLLATETDVGGPYRTWLAAPDSAPVWLDVDVAVNSNVAYFLKHVSHGLPKLDKFIGKAIVSGNFSSPYYPSDYAFIYYFARAYGGSHRPVLLKRVRALAKRAATDLDKALCLSSLIRLGDRRGTRTLAMGILQGQRRDGSWAAATFYADPVKDGKPYYDGAQALTTAFAIEALDLYRRSQLKPEGDVDKIERYKHAGAVLDVAKDWCKGMDKELGASVASSLDKLARSDNGAEIIGLAHRFNASLIKPLPKTKGKFLNRLEAANLFGWTAYTIYDDFLDGEGSTRLLPAANASMRRSLDGFSGAVPDDPSFRQLVRTVFDEIDGANAWEQAYRRLPIDKGAIRIDGLPASQELSWLAGRSLGHALPAMAILSASGEDIASAASRHMLAAFRHYLILRQLNDDVHDWPEDLQNGHMTPVVEAVLADIDVGAGIHDLSKLMPDARKMFWHRTLPRMCRLMDGQASLARKELAASGLLRKDNGMIGLITRLEAAVSEARSKQGRAKDFLRHYEGGDNTQKGRT